MASIRCSGLRFPNRTRETVGDGKAATMVRSGKPFAYLHGCITSRPGHLIGAEPARRPLHSPLAPAPAEAESLRLPTASARPSRHTRRSRRRGGHCYKPVLGPRAGAHAETPAVLLAPAAALAIRGGCTSHGAWCEDACCRVASVRWVEEAEERTGIPFTYNNIDILYLCFL